MTTLEEISSSRRSNRSWWNGQARFRITLLREDMRKPNGEQHRNLLKRGLAACLRSRRDFEYLAR